nr:MAG TPA: hypothetical protein [Herelleviridae sp.]
MLSPSTSHSLQEKKGSYRESLPIFDFLAISSRLQIYDYCMQ